jgi:hypothetical protein
MGDNMTELKDIVIKGVPFSKLWETHINLKDWTIEDYDNYLKAIYLIKAKLEKIENEKEFYNKQLYLLDCVLTDKYYEVDE